MIQKHANYCVNIYQNRFSLNDIQQNILLTYSLLVNGFAALILNLTVIVMIQVTSKRANRLVTMPFYLWLAVSDTLTALFYPACLVYLFKIHPQKQMCFIEMLAQAIEMFLTAFSCSCICLISLDRFARVKYLDNHYSTWVTKKKVQIAVFCAFVISLSITVVLTLSSLYNFHSVFIYIISIFCLICVLVMGITHKLVETIISRRRRNNERLQDVSRTLNRLTTLFLYSVFVFYGIYIVVSSVFMVLYKFLSDTTSEIKGWLEFMHFAGNLIGLTNSSANAVIFIVISKQVRRCFVEDIRNFIARFNRPFDPAS